ncbi:MAG: signal peptidase I [Ktedonobacteraceae bacterium]|nr:signal peptidase I [Ktedonobacteraceae bacterium]
MDKAKDDSRPRRSHLLRDAIETIVITLVLFLLLHLAIQNYHVDGSSMQPGLTTDENVIVNKTAYLFQQPARGDVIVFHFPCNPQVDYIKRVIGLPGDTIRTDHEHVWVNGVQLSESYISAPSNPDSKTWTVPANQYYVLGDNRPVSDDSRWWSCTSFVPKDDIVGKAAVVFWPLSNWEVIDTHASTFSQVKP